MNIIINVHKHHPFFTSTMNYSVQSQILFSSHVIVVKKIYCYLIDINDIYSRLSITRTLANSTLALSLEPTESISLGFPSYIYCNFTLDNWNHIISA